LGDIICYSAIRQGI